MSGPDREKRLADLARAKAVFQLRAIKAVICEPRADEQSRAALAKMGE